MLKFIKHNMSTIDGIAIYPIISLLIFSGFFAVLIYYVVRMRKAQVDELSNYPLDNE